MNALRLCQKHQRALSAFLGACSCTSRPVGVSQRQYATAPRRRSSSNTTATTRTGSKTRTTAKASKSNNSNSSRKSTAASTSTSASRAPTPPSTRPSSSSSAAAAAAAEAARAAEEERRMTENDTRLAIRMLMTRHLAREAARQKPEQLRREEQREALRRQQGDRLKRLEQKTQNSIALLGADADTVGDGVLPYFMRDTHRGTTSTESPAAVNGGRHGEGRALPAWLQTNTVTTATAASTTVLPNAWEDTETDADTDALFATEPLVQSRAVEAVSLHRLCQPDLSVYDSAFDQRISSEEVLKRERDMARLQRDAGIVFESDGPDSEFASPVLPSAGGGESSEAAREMAALQRTADDADVSMGLYHVSRDTAAKLRAQLQEHEEDEDGDGDDFSISQYATDPDDDRWVV